MWLGPRYILLTLLLTSHMWLKLLIKLACVIQGSKTLELHKYRWCWCNLAKNLVPCFSFCQQSFIEQDYHLIVTIKKLLYLFPFQIFSNHSVHVVGEQANNQIDVHHHEKKTKWIVDWSSWSVREGQKDGFATQGLLSILKRLWWFTTRKDKETEDEQRSERLGDSKWALSALPGLKRDIGSNNNLPSSA